MSLVIRSDGSPEAEALLSGAAQLARLEATAQLRPPRSIPKGVYHDLVDEVHKQTHVDDIDPERLAKIGSFLARSSHPMARGEAAWVYMQASLTGGNLGYLGASTELLASGMREAEGTAYEIELGLAKIAIPAYREVASGQAPNVKAMARRAHALNARLIEIGASKKDRMKGVAPELATVYVLAHFVEKYPDDSAGIIGWPATPWQNAHHGGHPKKTDPPPYNYDVVYGTHPGFGDKIQIKSSVEQGSVQRDLGRKLDTETYLKYWKDHHDPDISLIFGDVHLWNPQNNPYFINEIINASASSRRETILDAAAINIFSEIEATRARVAALAADKPAQ